MYNFDFRSEYRAVTDHYPNHEARPLIGIMGNVGPAGCELAEAYSRSVELAGGIPVIVPPTDNRVLLTSLLDRLDGLLLSGGADVNPLCDGHEPIPELHSISPTRDYAELLLARLAYDRNIPLLGICRGIQVMTIALGGCVHQDLRTCLPPETPLIKHSQDAPRHTPTHFVHSEEGSIIRQLLGKDFAVNSFHHQAVAEPGSRLRVTARAADGVVEAVESTEMKPIIGVQWHPECFAMADDRSMAPLFSHFVASAESFRRARALHHDILTLDSHCDTPMWFDKGADLAVRRDDVLVDLHRMSEGMLDAIVMAAYLPQGGRSDEELAAATATADTIIAQIKQRVKQAQGVQLVLTPKHLFAAKASGRKAVFIGIENGYAIGRDLSNVERYRRSGVIYITLCHNGDNDICDSARRSNREHGGLSDFGRQVVEEMNRTGIMVDLSHTSEETFYDAIALSTVPVICSHSSARALCNHPRNLTDDQLRAIAAKAGVAQATFYSGFLREEGEASIIDAVAHIMHMVDVAGIDHVGIGSDFDGDGGVRGLASPADYLVLTQRLLAEGLTPKQLRKLWGGNFVRVMSQVQFDGYIKF